MRKRWVLVPQNHASFREMVMNEEIDKLLKENEINLNILEQSKENEK